MPNIARNSTCKSPSDAITANNLDTPLPNAETQLPSALTAQDYMPTRTVQKSNLDTLHNAAYRECPNYIESQQALSLQSTERISYRDALLKIRSSSTIAATTAQTKATTALLAPSANLQPTNYLTSPTSLPTSAILPPVNHLTSHQHNDSWIWKRNMKPSEASSTATPNNSNL